MRRLHGQQKHPCCMQGGKLSVLAAAVDPRVVALCLLDPVDNTVWAPLGPGYPSAIQALKQLGSKQVLFCPVMHHPPPPPPPPSPPSPLAGRTAIQSLQSLSHPSLCLLHALVLSRPAAYMPNLDWSGVC